MENWLNILDYRNLFGVGNKIYSNKIGKRYLDLTKKVFVAEKLQII